MSADSLNIEDGEIELVTYDDSDCKAVIFADSGKNGEPETETEPVIVVVTSALAERDKSAEDVSEDRGDDDRELWPVVLWDTNGETEGEEEMLASEDNVAESILDGVMVDVEISELEAMDADCEGDEEVDIVADGENVFVMLGLNEFSGDNVDSVVDNALTIERSVSNGEEDREASKLKLDDDDTEMWGVSDSCGELEGLELELTEYDTAGDELSLPDCSPVELSVSNGDGDREASELILGDGDDEIWDDSETNCERLELELTEYDTAGDELDEPDRELWPVAICDISDVTLGDSEICEDFEAWGEEDSEIVASDDWLSDGDADEEGDGCALLDDVKSADDETVDSAEVSEDDDTEG